MLIRERSLSGLVTMAPDEIAHIERMTRLRIEMGREAVGMVELYGAAAPLALVDMAAVVRVAIDALEQALAGARHAELVVLGPVAERMATDLGAIVLAATRAIYARQQQRGQSVAVREPGAVLH